MMELDENKSFKIDEMGEHLSSCKITAIIVENFGRQDSEKKKKKSISKSKIILISCTTDGWLIQQI